MTLVELISEVYVAKILLDAHVGRDPSKSTHRTFGAIATALSTRFEIIEIPAYNMSTPSTINDWLSNVSANGTVFFGCDVYIVRTLRTQGWEGKIVWLALGDLAHGGSAFRTVLPFLSSSDTIWVTCEADRELALMFVDPTGAVPEIALIPYGIHIQDASPLSTVSRTKLRSRIGIEADDFVVMYSGRITAEKNTFVMLDTIRHLRLDIPHLKLMLVGRFENEPNRRFNRWYRNIHNDVEGYLDKYQLRDTVRILPWQKENHLHLLLKLSDLFLNLSVSPGENFGYSQVDAMNQGVPSLITSWGGLRDTVIDGTTGILIDTWVTRSGVRLDTPRLAASILLLASNNQVRAELANNARLHVANSYSIESYTEALTGLVAQVASRPTPSDRAKLSQFGAALQERFHRVRDSASGPVGMYPRFTGVDDSDFIALTAPYTSQGFDQPKPLGEMFLALPGAVVDDVFESIDFLWPLRIPISKSQARIIEQLSPYSTVHYSLIDGTESDLRSLIRKGVLGTSRMRDSVVL